MSASCSGSVDWIIDGWGISKSARRTGFGRRVFAVLFGDDEQYIFSGCYRSKRRAKKEITHYIRVGLSRGPFHGANRYLKQLAADGGI